MAEFTYVGVDQSGVPIEGTIDATNPREVYETRRAEGDTIYNVWLAGGPKLFPGRERPLRVEDLNVFTSQLASLTASGVPLAPALGELARETSGRRVSKVLERVRNDVDQGNSLEDALERHGDTIPPLYRALVRVGERTGNLPEVLRQLSVFGQRYLWLRYRLQIAMAYPIVLMLLSTLFLGIFVPEVIGQFEDIYATFGQSLPAITTFVLYMGRGLLYGILPLLVALLAILVLLRLFQGNARAHLWWDRFKLRIPLFGPVYQHVISARFFRALSLLLQHGAPIVECLHLAGLASGSTALYAAARQASAAVAEGTEISEALAETHMLRRTHAWILRQGERNGTFPETLARLATACDQEAERLEKRSLAQVGPAMVALFGVLIGVFVVACFVPIFQFSSFMGP